jgi:signal transduction histidine kinase
MDALGPRPYAELSVEDTGKGIAQEDLDHLFEPFFSTKGPRGSGLGLAVTWGIIEGHGGLIDVDSELGRGTTFAVRLPYQIPEAAESPAMVRVRMPDAAPATNPAASARGTG